MFTVAARRVTKLSTYERAASPSLRTCRGSLPQPPRKATDMSLAEAAVRERPQLPCLNHFVNTSTPLDGGVVLMTHLLTTSVPYIEALSQGFDLRCVIPIPYSLVPDAAEEVSQLAPVLLPSDLQQLPALGLEEVRQACASCDRVVVQEIGGYCAGHVGQLSGYPGFRGIVEDTYQGHWRYLGLPDLPCPVLSIADSPLKALENRQVGRSIAFSLEDALRRHFFRLPSECVIGLLGYGGIGEPAAQALADRCAEVLVFDVDPIQRARATTYGFATPDRATLLGRADVILGTSGRQSLGRDDVALLRDGVILASGSSKEVEFDLPGLRAAAGGCEISAPLTELHFPDRTAVILNCGRPINFLHQSVLGNVLDLVYTELYMCIRSLLEKDLPAGLGRLSQAVQHEIASVWCETYSGGAITATSRPTERLDS